MSTRERFEALFAESPWLLSKYESGGYQMAVTKWSWIAYQAAEKATAQRAIELAENVTLPTKLAELISVDDWNAGTLAAADAIKTEFPESFT